MPVGVPRVSYQPSEEYYEQWIDLYNRLFRERMLFLCQDLESELANQLVSIMIYLSTEDPDIDHFMYINSPGGSLINGIAVYDGINFVEAHVTTVCVGTSASTAAVTLCGGDNRIALPNGRVMIHQPDGGSDGQTSQVFSESYEMVRQFDKIVEIYMYHTGKDEQTVRLDMKRDEFMSAHEARTYGLVDEVSISF